MNLLNMVRELIERVDALEKAAKPKPVNTETPKRTRPSKKNES